MSATDPLPVNPPANTVAPPANIILVLVVDDEPGMRQGVQRALQDFTISIPDIEGEIRFRVEQTDSGEQALEMMRAELPGILLLDHKLPGMSGLEVLEQMDKLGDEVLTVMITAYASLQTAITATKRGAYDLLAKPFTPDELRSAIRKAARHLVLQRQARQLAAERRQIRYQFISILAHELKAPLYAVQTYLQLLRDRSAGDDPKTYSHMLDRSLIRVDGMEKLINDLLDLTRIESGNRTRDLALLDLRAVAADVVQAFAPTAAKRNITVTLHPGTLLTMTADRTEIEIILNNLVSNAIKYNRDNGRVDVTLTADRGSIFLAVADTGIGMAQKDLPRLFSEFVRIKTAQTRNILGSGLGLSIVKRLATLYGGDVTVRSEPDVGTTFTVTLAIPPPGAPHEHP